MNLEGKNCLFFVFKGVSLHWLYTGLVCGGCTFALLVGKIFERFGLGLFKFHLFI